MLTATPIRRCGRWRAFEIPQTDYPFIALHDVGALAPSRMARTPSAEKIRVFCIEMFRNPGEKQWDCSLMEMRAERFKLMFGTSVLRASFVQEQDRIAFLLRWSDA